VGEERGAASTVNGVNTADDASASGFASASTVNAVNTPPAQDTESSQQGQPEQPRRLPHDDAFSVVTHQHLKMEPAAFAQGARVWLTILCEKQPEA
jgi:ParB family chromosome partitioning protein